MNTKSRERVWVLLSELFVDTEHTPNDLLAIARSLQETGFSVDEVETILRRDVAPVCGEWMLYPGAIGPWPMFDEQELKEKIEQRLSRPWYKALSLHTGLTFMPGVKREWEVVRDAICSQSDA